MDVKIQKWGNSLALRIPKNFADETGISEGSSVEIKLEKSKIIISKLKKRKKYNLKDLLEGINKSNLHSETSTGKSVGNEILL